MPALGPGDGPGRPAPKRKRRRGGGGGKQQPSTEARKNAAYGSRPARPLPKPKPKPAPPPPQGDTKSDADLGRAKKHERTPKYREAVRDTYAEQGHKRRSEIAAASKNRPGAAAAEVERFHDERVRVERDKALANRAIRDALLRDNDRPRGGGGGGPSRDELERIRKGLSVIKHQQQAAAGRLAAAEHAQPKYGTGEAADGEKHHNILEGISTAIKAAAGVGTGTSKDEGAVASNEQFLGNLKRVEKASGPIDAAYQLALKPTIDATSKILEQTSRLSSASAGATEAALEGKNVAKGAVHGLIHNDKSYVDIAKKLGLHGAAAVIVGTAGDIAFDPSTYASFGLAAPATAAERTAARVAARKLAPKIRKAAKAGDEEAQAKLAAEYEDAMAAARRKAGKLEPETRGVQAGVRLPGGRQIRTKGRATAAVGKQATRVTRKVQASAAAKPINEVLRAFAPHVREQGVRPAEQATRQATKREAAALANRFSREGRQLGKFIQRATGGDVERVRELIDAIEAGTVSELRGPLHEAAEHMEAFHTRVADAFEKEGLPRPSLRDTLLASEDVSDALGVARQVLDARVTKATRAAQKADRDADVAAEVGGRQTARDRLDRKAGDAALELNAAERLAARVGSDRPLSHAEEQELVGRLTSVVDKLREDAHTNMARTRTNEELGAIRRGEAPLDAERAAAEADFQAKLPEGMRAPGATGAGRAREQRVAEVRQALRKEDFYKKKARDLRKAGNRQGARAAEAKAREARAVIKAHRAEVEPQHLAAVKAEGKNVLGGRAGQLERLLGQLQERVASEPPVGYAPRQTKAAMDAEREGAPLLVPAHPQGKAGFEQQRLERRRQVEVRADKPEYLDDELPQIEAKYGIKMGKRLASAALWRRLVQRTASHVTGDVAIEGDKVLYRIEKGQPKRVDPKDREANVQTVAEAAMRHALGDEDTGVYAVPQDVDKLMQERINLGGDKSAVGKMYDRGLRAFKAANTILRPGFFATTIAGNTWQQFLADISPKEMAEAWQHLAHMRAAELKATHPNATTGFRGEAGGRAAFLDKIAGNKTYVVDGRAVKFSDLFDEAIDAGVVRTGSRIGDPTELTLEEQAKRRLKRGGMRATTEWLGEVAEDLDDMTKAVVYVNARTKLGMTPTQAAERTFTKMIDYSDLSPAERTVFKRVMPFYVYTARNLPIQVKSLLARPGKLANYEKVRQALAELAGLPDDWQGQRSEAEQERMPVALPGVKSHGFQVFLDPRLPVADLAAPAQLTEGPSGGIRMLERYASGVAPPVKVPLELLLFKRRLDYDRPIDVPGSPPAAGALLKLIGATKKREYVQPATGEKYTGANPTVDYLLRSLGGSPGSLVASVGADVPDRSNLDPKARGAASFAGGFGLSASDPLYNPLYDTLRKLTEKHYAKRQELKGQDKRDSVEDIRNEDAIDALNNVKRKLQAAIGFPEQKKNLFGLERDRLEVGTREPAEIRAERRRLDKLRHQYGG